MSDLDLQVAEGVAMIGNLSPSVKALARAYFELVGDPNFPISGSLSLMQYVTESYNLQQFLLSLLQRGEEVSLDDYRGDIGQLVEAARNIQTQTEPETTDRAIVSGQWVEQAFNIGKVIAVGGFLCQVRWLNETAESFAATTPVVAYIPDLSPIDEPKLSRREAAWYSGMHYQWIYELNKRGTWGGTPRIPLFVYPHELDAYLESRK